MSEALVTIGEYFDVTEAHIAAGFLRSEGIPVYPRDVDSAATNPLPGIGLGGVRLQVPAGFEREALRLLADRESSDDEALSHLASGDGANPEETRSDRLGFGVFRISNRLRSRAFWIKFVLLDIAFFGLVLLAIWAAS